MIPADWGSASHGPRRFRLPVDAADLWGRYDQLGRAIQLGSILGYVDDLGGTDCFVESPYVDWDYRSEFSNLYARSFNPPPDKCERLLFFRDATFLGSVVLRPLHKPVGRTAILPPPDIAPFVCCQAPNRVRPWGQEWTVHGWPFLSQDGMYGRCAHAAIWSIARYHHLRHATPRHSIAAVVEASGTRQSVDRTFASGGLYLHEVAAAFAGLGLPALQYDPDHLPSGEELEPVVCRYLNSGFPVALNTEAHLTVLIGYGHHGDDLFFIRSDDNLGPYERVDDFNGPNDRLKEWKMLLVPLPARVHVPGEMAELVAMRTFLQEAGATPELLPLRHQLANGELRVRTYAVEAAEYKKRLGFRQPSPGMAVVNHHRFTPAAVWVWITEFQRRDLPRREGVIAEVAVDATSHRSRPAPQFANLPGRCVAWLPGEHLPRATAITTQEPYGSTLRDRTE